VQLLLTNIVYQERANFQQYSFCLFLHYRSIEHLHSCVNVSPLEADGCLPSAVLLYAYEDRMVQKYLHNFGAYDIFFT